VGLVGFNDMHRLLPPQRAPKYMKQIINNCLLNDPDQRPAFIDIVKYLEEIERQPKSDPRNPVISNLKEFLN
jgi:hypothetical protein